MIGLKALLGGHSGENLGQYMVGLFDRIGIMDKKRSNCVHFDYILKFACHLPALHINTR